MTNKKNIGWYKKQVKEELTECPICRGSLKLKHEPKTEFNWQGKVVIIKDLELLQCMGTCGESFYTLESEAKMEMILRK